MGKLRKTSMRSRFQKGDLVRKMITGGGIATRTQCYVVERISDQPLEGGMREQHAIAHLATESGNVVGPEYVWDLELVRSRDRQELLELRVGIGRLAHRLGYRPWIPGWVRGQSVTETKLLEWAARQDKGWSKLLAMCLEGAPQRRDRE